MAAIMEEGEMSQNEHNLVDGYYEEGQYDAGMKALQQLRSGKFKPSPAHIRQLIYIALYPPKYKEKETPVFDPLASPKKLERQQRSQLTMAETTTITTHMAQTLLKHFANTNSPEAIFRALPHESEPGPLSLNVRHEEMDSDLATNSQCILNCKNCWAFLADGYVANASVVPTQQTSKSVPIRRSMRHGSDLAAQNENESDDVPAAMGESSWAVLDFLLDAFERDEQNTKSTDIPLYSPLLLSQIPVDRGGKGDMRWNVASPLEIIILGFKSSNPRRQEMGKRLLSLLVHLTSTVHIDYLKFISAVFSYLTALPFDQVVTLLQLEETDLVLQFKMSIYQKYLTPQSGETRRAPRPKARGRKAQPEEGPSEPAVAAPESVSSSSICRPVSFPSTATLLNLLERGTCSASLSSSAHSQLRFELLRTYGTYQSKHAGANRDSEWPAFVRDTRLREMIDHGLFDENSAHYLTILRIDLDSWIQSL